MNKLTNKHGIYCEISHEMKFNGLDLSHIVNGDIHSGIIISGSNHLAKVISFFENFPEISLNFGFGTPIKNVHNSFTFTEFCSDIEKIDPWFNLQKHSYYCSNEMFKLYQIKASKSNEFSVYVLNPESYSNRDLLDRRAVNHNHLINYLDLLEFTEKEIEIDAESGVKRCIRYYIDNEVVIFDELAPKFGRFIKNPNKREIKKSHKVPSIINKPGIWTNNGNLSEFVYNVYDDNYYNPSTMLNEFTVDCINYKLIIALALKGD